MSPSGVVLRRQRRVIYLNILLVFDIVLSACEPVARAATSEPAPANPITVTVTSTSGIMISTAVARVLGTPNIASVQNNKLMLPDCSVGNHISVWAPGYYIETFPCNGSTTYSVQLGELEKDNVNYSWESAQNCAGCHSDSQGRTEYSEWARDGHSRVFVDSYFWNIYMGTDINGNRGPETSWSIDESGQKLRLPSDSEYNPGFRLDYPSENGNCAYCHAPAAVKAMEQGLNFATWSNTAPGRHLNVEIEGITCDICHKVSDVLLGQDGRPFAERPGILSFLFNRPSLDQVFHIGPLIDLKPENPNVSATCSPVFSESRFCAACHYGKFFDTVIYNSYGEWLNSSYSNRETSNFRSCQDCHMPSAQEVGNTPPRARAACSAENLNFRNFNHNMMDRYNNNGDPDLVKNAARIEITARKEDGKINVAVRVQSVDVGHKFPTDSPLRHLILVVAAKDRNDTPLAQVGGPMIPLWGGNGDTAEDYAGRPGEIYANILQDKDTSLSPTVAYWNPTLPAWGGSDTRLKPGEPTQSEYSFSVPLNGEATITARLIYRYAFIDIIRQKGWTPKDFDVTTPVSVQVP